jgi:hypothetical protein
MGRTAMQFYGRDAAYSLQDDSTSPSNMPLVNIALPAPADTMTWQQKKDFGTTVVSETPCAYFRLPARTDAHRALGRG